MPALDTKKIQLFNKNLKFAAVMTVNLNNSIMQTCRLYHKIFRKMIKLPKRDHLLLPLILVYPISIV